MGGSIDAESEVGKGTTFIIQLPLLGLPLTGVDFSATSDKERPSVTKKEISIPGIEILKSHSSFSSDSD
eukprot:CAMPEP_0170497870 /NCGR_PEP_ID=MMETSP0208-20121228/26098_1 /TAXON_ID=197538 /ORGANISM="Strombidium inclinatum, Strain S3" /LENGTH=68 /DNA_ID=CAMNT_0010774829 /DNA_START=1728 /DNA_END=1934 /DNA_ORIENTATION=+